MILIVLILVVAVIAIELFVPKHLDPATGKVTTFKKSSDTPSTTTLPAESALITE